MTSATGLRPERAGMGEGENLRSATCTFNSLNQYTRHANSDFLPVLVNGNGAYRHGEYFWKELDPTQEALNSVTVIAGTSTSSRNIYAPPATEQYGPTDRYDEDGNLLKDGC